MSCPLGSALRIQTLDFFLFRIFPIDAHYSHGVLILDASYFAVSAAELWSAISGKIIAVSKQAVSLVCCLSLLEHTVVCLRLSPILQMLSLTAFFLLKCSVPPVPVACCHTAGHDTPVAAASAVINGAQRTATGEARIKGLKGEKDMISAYGHMGEVIPKSVLSHPLDQAMGMYGSYGLDFAPLF